MPNERECRRNVIANCDCCERAHDTLTEDAINGVDRHGKPWQDRYCLWLRDGKSKRGTGQSTEEPGNQHAMNNDVNLIPLSGLALGFVPVLLGLGVYFYWSLRRAQVLHALVRMLAQLLLIGYLLAFIFGVPSAPVSLLVLLVMVLASGWIALGSVATARRTVLLPALAAIALGGGFTLLLVTQGVLRLRPWYWPQYLLPLAGMIFANAMNSISLALERCSTELQRGLDYESARNTAFQAAMIPTINSLFAVGLVSLPGMMTGQILAGVSPLVAARYQILVMCMIFGSGAICAALFLIWARSGLVQTATAASPE